MDTKTKKITGCSNIKQNLKSKKMVKVAQGESGIVFKLNNLGNIYAVKFSIADSYYENNKMHPINVENSLLKKIETLRKKSLCPHFNTFIGSSNCNLKSILDSFYNNNYINSLVYEGIRRSYSSYPKNSFYRIFFSEFIDGDLKGLIVSNKKKKFPARYLKVIMFQIAYSLCVLQYYIKEFKHNDLHLGNIFFKYNKIKNLIDEKNVQEYEIFGEKYFLPMININIMISDFDFASSKTNRNSKVEDTINYGSYGINNEIKPYFDYHLFYNLLYSTNVIPKTLLSTKNKLFPDKYLEIESSKTKMGRLCDPDSSLNTPAEIILFHDIFKEFKVKKRSAKKINTYYSGVPVYDKIKTRADMFNRHLK